MSRRALRINPILGLLGLGATGYVFLTSPGDPVQPLATAISAGLIAALAYSLLPTEAGIANLSHTVALATGIAFGPQTSAAALAIGLVAGHALAIALSRTGQNRSLDRTTPEAAGDFGQQMLAVLVGLAAYQTAGGTSLALSQEFITAAEISAVTIGFLVPFASIQILRVMASSRSTLPGNRVFLSFTILIGLLPVPYSVLTAAAASLLGPSALLVLGGMVVVMAPIVRSLILAERNLKRRYLELESLNQVSHALRTSLNMQSLLNSVYAQVALLMGIESFFIALYDPEAELLSYPLAIKNGRRQEWPTRGLADRLTDRVIVTGEPLLIPQNAPGALAEMGFPELENAPEAWLGVPLALPQRVLGCLGVFHTEPGRSLSRDDLDLLRTVASQAAVALENAELYTKTEQRAQALASINLISASMSSSLDPAETLDLVAESLIEVGGGTKAALYLYQSDRGLLELAHSQGLSDQFRNSFSTLDPESSAVAGAFAARSIQPRPDVQASELENDLKLAFEHEGIRAAVDLPLDTPAGTIGMASVYFDEPQTFRPEQIELLETLVAHSSLALANARAHAATDQALHQQIDHLSRIESIGRELVSTLNPDDLFASIVNHSLKATGAESGFLAVRQPDEPQLEIVALRSPRRETTSGGQYLSAQDTFAAEAFARQDVLVLDRDRLARTAGIIGRDSQSALIAPIIRWGRGIGLIAIESPEPDTFQEHHVSFMRHLTVQASIAISNANLYQQLEDNLRELSLLYQASVQVSTTLDLESVTMAVADSVSVALEADAVHVSTWDPVSQRLTTVASVENARPRSPLPARTIDQHTGPSVWKTLQIGTPVQVRSDGAREPGDVNYLTEELDAVSMLALPLRLGAETVGLVEVAQQALRTFDEGEIRTAQTIASQAAMAIQNSELFRRIRTSHDRLLAILNSTDEGMAMISTAGNVLLANQRIFEITGLDEASLIGQSFHDLPASTLVQLGFTPREAARFGEAALAKSFPDAPLTQYRTESPETSVIERILQPIREAAGDLIGWLIVLRDVTEREEIEAARSHLTEMIVHDLRSPLTTLLGSLRLLDDALHREVKLETGQQALTVSKRSVQQMLGLVNSLLDIARLESRELQLELSQVDLRSLLDSISDSFVPTANEQGIIFTYSRPPEPLEIRADEEKLRRSFMNLVDNAIKFTPEGGQVRVEISSNGAGVEVSVIDEGPGIPEEMRERVFERFAQVPGTRGRRRGTGLGLAFTKLAIEAHGGEIAIDDNPDGGSIFRTRLPLSSGAQPEN